MPGSTSYENLVLRLHVLAELIAGFVLLLSPSTFVPTATPTHSETLRGVGNGAISIGLVGVALLNMSIHSRPRILLGIIAQYHCVVVWLMLREPLPNLEIIAPSFHGLFAIYFLQRILRA